MTVNLRSLTLNVDSLTLNVHSVYGEQLILALVCRFIFLIISFYRLLGCNSLLFVIGGTKASAIGKRVC